MNTIIQTPIPSPRSLLRSAILLLAFSALLLCPLAFTGCQQPPSERVAVVTTLRVLGATAQASMDASTDLLARGSISVAQWHQVADFYDRKWQPAFRVAVSTSGSDLTLASPELSRLAVELAILVQALTAH